MTRAEIEGRFDLDRETYEAIIEHARSDFPYEVCGLLGGRDGAVMRRYPIPNAIRSMTSYDMDSKALLHAMNDMEDQGWELLGIYHSHTHTEAFPSPTDIKLAFYRQAVYLIVSLQDEQPVMRAFNIVGGVVTERVLTVEGEEVAAGSR